jgi:Bacterial Ig-like domain (group 1)/Calcineurin-like phosphoesterase
MKRSRYHFGQSRILAVAALVVLATCTDDRAPLAPTAPGTVRADQVAGGSAVLVGAGDVASCANDNDELTAQLLDGIPGTVFTAGDNAYPNGRTVDYQNCYAPTWGRHLNRTIAVMGNHEYDSSATADPSWDYFGDRAGPRGLGYYSLDLAAWHVVVLNDNIPFDAGSEQDQWLRNDLAAHPNRCILAIWHQPYFYSSKNPSGDVILPSRKIFWDRLYAAGADVVVDGHQHQYERFAPMNPDGQADAAYGVREFIVGTGGESSADPVLIAPNSVVRSRAYGVMKFTLNDGGYDWQFFPIPGVPFTDAGSASCHDAPSGVSAIQTTVTASPAAIYKGTQISTITVTARTASGIPVSGATVVLAATGAGNTLKQPPATTNANGVATGTLSSIVEETKAITATVGGTAIAQTATVVVTAAAAAKKSKVATAQPYLAVGTGTATITVTVLDASSQPVSGATVTLAASGSGNVLTQPAGLTNASGVATATLQSSVAETKTVTATANGTTITQTAKIVVTIPSAGKSTFAASPTTITAETGVSTLTATVKEAGGHALAGAAVVFSATGTGNTLTQPVALTNAQGLATGTLSSSVAGQKTISAAANGTAITKTVNVTVNPTAISSTLSTVTAAPSSIPAGTGTATITVIVMNGNGQPVSGATVVLAASGSGNTLTQPAGTTNSSGVATGTLQSSVAEVKTVGATANGVALSQTATVAVTGGGVSASQSGVAASPVSFTAGSGSTTITVTVRDGGGGPISGANVVLTTNGTQNTLAQPVGPTDANGVATGTLSSTKAELKTISATADGTPITQTAAVTVTAGLVSGSTSVVTAAPTSIAPGTETSTIRVTAKDAYGNPVAGATVNLAATGSGNTLTQPTSPTNSVGVTSGTLSSTIEEVKTVSAIANGMPISQTTTVTVVAPVQAAITHTLLTSGNDANNVKVYTTASIAPAPNTLITIAVATHQTTSAAPLPTISGGGMASWDVVGTVTFDTLGLPRKRVTIFRAMSAAPGSGPITITSSATLSNCQWIVSQWSGVETSGTNGSGAVVQTGSNAADAVTTLATPLTAFGNAANVAYGVFGINSNVVAINPGSGFTEIDEQPSTESTAADLFAEWAVNRPTISATWPSKNAGGLGVEIKAQASP